MKSKKIELLEVKAPVDTRFAIGTTGSANDAISCETKVLEKNTVLYEVSCPQQGPGQELFATITYGDFDYGFTKSLK